MMHLRNWIRSVLAALVLLLPAANAMAQASLVSDREDYLPFETAYLFGSGFLGGEGIDLSIRVWDPATGLTVTDYDWTVFDAGPDGAFIAEYMIPLEAFGMNLTATALGLTSGLLAQTTFTDGRIDTTTTISLSPASTVTDGDLVTITGKVVQSGSHFHTGGAGDPISGETLQIQESLDNGVTFPVNLGQGNTNALGEFSVVISTTGQGGSTRVFRAHFPSTGGQHGFEQSRSDPATLTIQPLLPNNQPPVIDCLNPTADLGSLVGCLNGSTFSRNVSVSWRIDGGAGAYAVVATIAGVDYTVATVTDADGDPLAIDVDASAAGAILTGPGAAADVISYAISAFDGIDEAEDTCTLTVEAQIVYNFGGILSPLSPTSTTKVKRGSAAPVKFRILDCDGVQVSTDLGAGSHIIGVAFSQGNAPAGDPQIDDSGTSGDNGVAFRYASDCWIFNLKTNSSYAIGATYEVKVMLNDGTVHSAFISIK